MSPEISIIVPVYKAERYIRKCLDSIQTQSFEDWECLLIDDGSPDNCGRICDEYALGDSRFKVFHKLNGGVSSARNLGLDKASGEWITFIDADDFISPTFIENLYSPVMNEKQLDFVHGGCSNWKRDNVVGVNQSFDYYVGEASEKIFNEFRGLIVSKLFRLTKINSWLNDQSLRFDEKMKIAEDMAFTIDYILNVDRYAFVQEVGYFYRQDNMSSATKSKSMSTYEVELHSFNHLYKSTLNFIKSHNLDVNSCSFRFSQRGTQLQNTILSLYRNKYSRKERLALIRKDFDYGKLKMLDFANEKRLKAYVFSLLKRNVILFDYIVSILYKLRFIK